MYGELLSRIIEAGWRTLSIGYLAKHSRSPLNKSALTGAINEYDGAWAAYNGFRISNPFGATLYKDTYSHGSPGMGASVDALRNSSLKTDDVIGSAGAGALRPDACCRRSVVVIGDRFFACLIFPRS